VAQASFDAVERARRGDGPSLIESKTYRIRGHSRSDRNRYRTKEEIETWQARDPITSFERELSALGFVSGADIQAIRADVEGEIAEAIEFAKASPAPSIEELTRYVYSD
jgi:TPP-dependent pyruvate/acetoin dehydrogenase alpha subunit